MCDASHDLRLARSRAVEVGHHRTPDGHAVSQEIEHTSLFHFNSNEQDTMNRQQALKVPVPIQNSASDLRFLL
jgi:hypothetical protein